jgi:hypothetical protein
MIPSQKKLEDAIYDALDKALIKLLSMYPDHNFYYFALITTGEASSPFISAWSRELLENSAKSIEDTEDLKWSYSESPLCFFAEEYFKTVDDLFQLRPEMHSDLSDEEWKLEYNQRLDAMEFALKRLDLNGVFGRGEARNKIYINVECMPPDYTNTERAYRLNPINALNTWLEEAAE